MTAAEEDAGKQANLSNCCITDSAAGSNMASPRHQAADSVAGFDTLQNVAPAPTLSVLPCEKLIKQNETESPLSESIIVQSRTAPALPSVDTSFKRSFSPEGDVKANGILSSEDDHHLNGPGSKRIRLDSTNGQVQHTLPIMSQLNLGTNQISLSPNTSQNLPSFGNIDDLPKHNGGSSESLGVGERQHAEKGDKRQDERLTKQKLREQERLERERKKEEERLERERKKEEERRLKKEERERKELERKQKRELVEKERQEKKEQERIKKEQRRLQIEEEKKAKELEKMQKEEERKKAEEMKDRKQMKILNFFAVKKDLKVKDDTLNSSVLSSSLKEKNMDDSMTDSRDAPKQDSYLADFLPFFQKRNVLLAPHSQLSPELLSAAKLKFDTYLTENRTGPDLNDVFEPPRPRSHVKYTSSEALVEALNSSKTTEESLHEMVKNIPPIKYLQFYENAKPPYVGTWCSEKHLTTSLSASEPLDTEKTGLDYNYDSDLDWQEGDEGDGEDIDDLDDAEDEDDEPEDDEMEDFVDNTETSKRAHVGPLQSVSIWNDGTKNEIFDSMKYERIHLEIDFPIDPFKNYWSKDTELKAQAPVESQEKPVLLVMQLGTTVKVETSEKSLTPNVLTPQKSIIKDAKVVESLVEFIKKNSDFSIGTLSELAKKEFRVYTKSMLKHTIQEVAVYNKKTSSWEIKE